MKRYLNWCLLLLASIGIGISTISSQIIPVDPPDQPDLAKLIADDLVNSINPELERRIAWFKNRWETCWENSREEPDVIVEAMGPKAARFFLAGSIERDYMQAIAQALDLTFEELVGDGKYVTTKYPITVYPDGTVIVHKDGGGGSNEE